MGIGATISNFQNLMTMYNEYTINVLSKCIVIVLIEVYHINSKKI